VGVEPVWNQTALADFSQSRAYIGSNPRETHGNKLSARPRPDPKEKFVNVRRTGG
jgi:hypothetical protein